jgi:hypothetical protein
MLMIYYAYNWYQEPVRLGLESLKFLCLRFRSYGLCLMVDAIIQSIDHVNVTRLELNLYSS